MALYNPFQTDPTVVNFINQAEDLTLKQRTQNLLDIYRDNWEHIIEYELSKQFTEKSYKRLYPLITTELNLLKMIIDQTALVYKEPAKRAAVMETAEGEEEIVDSTYEEILGTLPIDQAMKSVDTYNKLANQVLLKVVWRDGGLDYDIINFNTAVVYTDPKDWKRLIAVKYSMDVELPDFDNEDRQYLGLEHDGVKMEKYSRQWLWNIEDDGSSWVREYVQDSKGKARLVSKEENPYKDAMGNAVLPFVLFTRRYPDTQLLDWTSGTDMIDGTVNSAINMIHLNTLIKYQSHKQVVITAGDAEALPSEANFDAMTAFLIADPEGRSDVKTVDMQAAIDKIYDIIERRAITLLKTRGIPSNAISVQGGQATSGISMKLDKWALLEQRQNDIELYRLKERELFEITRIVNNYHNTKKIDVKAKFKMDFGEIEFPVTQVEKAQADTINISQNITNPVHIIMRENPDLTEEEAELVWAKNKAVNQGNVPDVVIQPPQQPTAITEEEQEGGTEQ